MASSRRRRIRISALTPLAPSSGKKKKSLTIITLNHHSLVGNVLSVSCTATARRTRHTRGHARPDLDARPSARVQQADVVDVDILDNVDLALVLP
jgi:hypothetical protein